jgi:hypothetical protein
MWVLVIEVKKAFYLVIELFLHLRGRPDRPPGLSGSVRTISGA